MDEGKNIRLAMAAAEPEITYEDLLKGLGERGINVTYQKLWNVLNGRTTLRRDLRDGIWRVLKNYEKTYSNSPHTSLNIEEASRVKDSRQEYTDFALRPVIVWPDLPSSDWNRPAQGEEKLIELPAMLAGESRRTCRVKDDSLNPIAMKGQRIVIVEDDNPQEGMIVFGLKGNEVKSGYYERDNGSYILRPPNEEYDPVILDDTWTLIGFMGAVLPYASAERGSAVWDFVEGVRRAPTQGY